MQKILFTTFFIIIILCSIILLISIYNYFTYDPYSNTSCNNNYISKDKDVNHNNNNSNSTINNDNNYKTLNNQGYECFKWENDDLAVKIENNQVMCASLDGKKCITDCNENYDLPINLGNPLICGDYHKKLYDFTGYDDPEHWCSTFKDLKVNVDFEKDLTDKYSNKDMIKNGDRISLRGGRDKKFCSDDSRWMQCNREGVDFWEQFIIEKNNSKSINDVIKDGDIISIRGVRNNRYCSYDDDRKIKCNIGSSNLWEKYIIENRTKRGEVIRNNNDIALISLKTKKYCSDVYNKGDFNKVITCENDYVGQWEEFRISKL